MRPSLLLLLLTLTFAAAASAQPGDVEAGRGKAAQMCAVCHGASGIATQPDAPHLAGQPADYLAAQLRAYRSGARQHPQMNVIAKPLTDADIARLAAWFSSIRIEAQSPK